MTREFDCFYAKELNIHFACPECCELLESGLLEVPLPNFDGDSFTKSLNQEDDYIECPKCKAEYSISIQSSLSGGFVHIDELDDEYDVQVIETGYDEYEDAVFDNTKYYDTFSEQFKNLNRLLYIKSLDQELEVLQRKMIFTNLITILETYLSDALIVTIFKYEKYYIKFVETYKDFKKEKLSLNKIFTTMDNLKKRTKSELLDLIYHNIPKIKGIYKDTLGVEFPKISEVSKLVALRHDLVHRNGRNKDGNEIFLTLDDIVDAFKIIEDFIKDIDVQISNKIDFE